VSGYGAVVCCRTVGMVRSTRVPSGGGVVVMGTVGSPRCILENGMQRRQPLRRKTQVTKAVGGEHQAPKANGFT
jgi:hypothetical protein